MQRFDPILVACQDQLRPQQLLLLLLAFPDGGWYC
jgi:hypothetical protein